jgi:hypothetical protein
MPFDMEDAIHDSLFLIELASASETSRSFRAAYQRRLDELQKARCDLAAKWFGRKRVACLAAVVKSFLKGERMDASFVRDETTTCRISVEGLLRIDGPVRRGTAGQQAYEVGLVNVALSHSVGFPRAMSITVPTFNKSNVRLFVSRLSNIVEIHAAPSCEEDLEPMAFVQALLTWEFAPTSHDASAGPRVCITGVFHANSDFTLDARQEHILPILPLVSKHKNWSIRTWGLYPPQGHQITPTSSPQFAIVPII